MNAAGLYWNRGTRGIDWKFLEISYIGHGPAAGEAVSFATSAGGEAVPIAAHFRLIAVSINKLRP
jgi:hypothetical protein